MIAILLCTYNGEKNLRQQIDSILNQTYKDIKLFISDDGSIDSTIDIITDYTVKYPDKVNRIQLKEIHNGACMHFLKALQTQGIMDADYVMFSDQDDVWFENKVERTLQTMESISQLSDKPILVHCDSVLVNDDLQEIAPSFTRFANMNQRKATFSHLLVQNTVTGAAMMMNKALTEKLQKIPENCMMHDHWIALVASALGEIHFIDEPLYYYRQHESNVLGANKGGIVEEVINFWGGSKEVRRKRAEVREQVRKNYEGMIRQAECLLSIHGEELSHKTKKALRAYVDIPNRGPLGRVMTILRYNITCDNWYRVVGQCSFFLRSRIIQ